MANQDDADPADIEFYKTFKDLPMNLSAAVKAIGFADFSNMDEEEREVYDKVREGKCMTCGSTLGEHANFILTRAGIVGGYCSGVCHSDMAVLGFLQEEHQEIIDRIKFREGGADEAETHDGE